MASWTRAPTRAPTGCARSASSAGDGVAFFMENSPRYYELLWAAQRSGVRFTCISSKLTAGEVEYIVERQRLEGAGRLRALGGVALAVAPLIARREAVHGRGAAGPFASLEDARAAFPATPIADQSAGRGHALFVGHHRPAQGRQARRRRRSRSRSTRRSPLAMIGQALYGWTPDTVYLSPAPLYHAAPLGWSMAVQSLGGTVMMMEKFDPETGARLDRAIPGDLAPSSCRPTSCGCSSCREEVRAKYDVSVADQRLPRRRAMPGAGQGADDRLVGTDHPRILRRHRGQRLHHHRPRGVAAEEGLASARGSPPR